MAGHSYTSELLERNHKAFAAELTALLTMLAADLTEQEWDTLRILYPEWQGTAADLIDAVTGGLL